MSCKAISLSFGLLFIALFLAVWHDILPPKSPRPIIEDQWFGPGQRPKKENKEIKPFKINFGDKNLKDLKSRITSDLERLKAVNIKPLEDSAFEYGFNIDYLVNEIGPYWLNKYDWKTQEKMLNTILPQFKTSIDGIDVHFAHVKPKVKGKKVLPILMVHGWPGSFIEFTKIIPMMTEMKDQDFVFEVIAPSIPGYGFSSSPAKMGFDAIYSAKIFTELMQRLGHDTFYCQGGDWGSLITDSLTTLYPEKVRGLHLNMIAVNTPSANLKLIVANLVPSLVLEKKDYSKVIPIKERFGVLLKESGYMHIQATKPDTVGKCFLHQNFKTSNQFFGVAISQDFLLFTGLGLTTSPLGLASYILEKFSTWTKKSNPNAKDGNLLEKFTIDELLNNIMIYWINGNIIPSQRFYKENFGENFGALDNVPIEKVPVALAAFPEEIFNQPENFITGKYRNIVSYTDMPVGGHFAAYEQPKLLFDDIIQFVAKVENDTKNKDEL